jgi:hypothetical protein
MVEKTVSSDRMATKMHQCLAPLTHHHHLIVAAVAVRTQIEVGTDCCGAAKKKVNKMTIQI